MTPESDSNPTDSRPSDFETGLVSIVIPTYNRAYIVGLAIESVLRQTYRPIEILVVDDGSTDDTRRVVQSFGDSVRYLYQTNSGVSAARNLGLRQARGEFVGLLDSDDQWLPWKLAAEVALLRSLPDLGMVWTDMSAIDDEGTVLSPTFIRTYYSNHRRGPIERLMKHLGSLRDYWSSAPPAIADRPFYHGYIFDAMLLGNLVHTSTVLLRWDRLRAVGGFDTSLIKTGEDYEFHLHTCFLGNVGFLDAPSILYRYGTADQLTGPRAGALAAHMARNNLSTVLKWVERGRERIRLPRWVVRRHIADSYGWVGEAQIQIGDVRSGRFALARSFFLWPFQPRRFFLLLYYVMPRAFRQLVRALFGRPPGR